MRVMLVVAHKEDVVSLVERIFHLLSNKHYRYPSIEDYTEDYFQKGFASTEQYFSRLGGQVDVRGKSVLDVGCGSGTTCVYIAQRGAKRVLGIDINEDSIVFARKKVASEYKELADRLSFKAITGPKQLDGQKFDIILSKDSFEHIADPDQYLRELKDYVADDGIIVIGFSPLWKAPFGGHITDVTKFPWAHLLFPERIVMKERRRLFNPADQAERFEDMWGGLNKMSLKKFRTILKNSDLEPVYVKTNVHTRPLAKVFDVLRHLPGCEEYFTFNVYSIWRLKKSLVSSSANTTDQRSERGEMQQAGTPV